jgi:TIR domain
MTTETNQAYPYVFLSYASADRERAFLIADLLESKGVSVWIDRRSIAGGTSWSAEIVEGIKGCQALVALCSPAAVQSRNVQQEIQLAWEHERKILPLQLEPTSLPSALEYALAGRQWVEVSDLADET